MTRVVTVQDLRLILIVVVYLLPAGSLGSAFAETYMIPMRDGVKLATDVYLPEGDGPWPAILERTPYGRVGMGEFTKHPWAEDYALVSQDWRGYGDSEGDKMPLESDGWGELQDGYDTVEWIASQDWSNGKIGGFGVSIRGDAQNLLAGSYHPNLVCQMSYAACSDQYSQGYFRGGVFVRNLASEQWHIDYGTPETLARVLSHPNYDSYWESMNSETRVAGMRSSGLFINGWYDAFLQGTINSFVEKQHNGGEGSRGNQRLLIGPWVHGWPALSQGQLVYPENSLWPPPSPNRFLDYKKFFDYWLKGIDEGYTDLPTVRYYVMGDVDDPNAPGNEWRSADDWPIPYENFSLYLSPDSLRREPTSDSTEHYSYDPKSPVPTLGGAVFPAEEPAGPHDQRSVEEREDVLIYTSDPLPVPVEVTGRIYVQLFASSSCPDTDFVAKLTDVYPDGRSMLVTDGIIRARHRNSMAKEEFMVPGNVYEFWIDLWSTSIVFNKGHRIRVAIASSSYPRFDPNPNTGHHLRADNQTVIADNTIHTGATYPTRIILPLAGPDSDGDGAHDILDPLPDQEGPHTREDIAKIIQDTDQLISSITDQGLRSTLQAASEEAKALLTRDLVASGHLILLIQESLIYNTSGIDLPEARRVIDKAMDLAMGSLNDGRYSEMAQYLRTGWMLGTTREALETLPGRLLLLGHFSEAERLMDGEPVEAASIAEWCSQTGVQLMAAELQLCQDSWPEIVRAVSDRDLKILEAIFNPAVEAFTDMDEDVCESKLSQFRSRLGQLGIQCPEPTLLPLFSILGLILLPSLLRRR